METNDVPDSTSLDTLNATSDRCDWVRNNPDIVVTIHALRIELIVRMVMSGIVPESQKLPFQYWLRFEFRQSGNPHVHGQSWVAGNPMFENVVLDQETLDELLERNHPDADSAVVWSEAENDVCEFFSKYCSEQHPCKDDAGVKLYPYKSEMLEKKKH